MIASGQATVKFGNWRIQFYYPNITARLSPLRELMVGFDTCARIALDRRNDFYAGAGLQLLGFGLAADYYQKPSQNGGAEHG